MKLSTLTLTENPLKINCTLIYNTSDYFVITKITNSIIFEIFVKFRARNRDGMEPENN